jgi:hypothetical protein
MSRSSLIPASSTPIAVLMPRCSKALSGATPLRSRKFELQPAADVLVGGITSRFELLR